MVVMEPGSDWPGQIGDSTNLVAFSQEGEDLSRRTQEKIDALRRRRQGVRIAVLACSSATGGTSARQRAQLARVLLGAVKSTTCGRLTLTASGLASHQLRQELVALAGELTDELRGTTATISLRFADAARVGSARLAHGRAVAMTGTDA
jgi:hypothetical protein